MSDERPSAQAKIEATLASAERNRGWHGCYVLFQREVDRFMGVAKQTLISPALTTLLWFLVFGYSLGDRIDSVAGVPYVDFLVPGLVMMSLIMNAFMNAGFSFFLGKIHGMLTDLLVTPLTPNQIILAYGAASTLRAVLVGAIVWAVAASLGATTFAHPAWTLAFLSLTSWGFAVIGLIVGILADDFDHVNFIPSFLLTPLTFLGGVFYSVTALPEPWDAVSLFNPIVYMVNGLRHGMTGYSDVPVGIGLLIVAVFVAGGWFVAYWLLASGKKLRD